MQEDIERRTVALSVNATKLTGRASAKILAAAAENSKGLSKSTNPSGKAKREKANEPWRFYQKH